MCLFLCLRVCVCVCVCVCMCVCMCERDREIPGANTYMCAALHVQRVAGRCVAFNNKSWSLPMQRGAVRASLQPATARATGVPGFFCWLVCLLVVI